jgi:hypothetical protein
LAPKTAARKVPEIWRGPARRAPDDLAWIFSSAAIVGVASASSSYGLRLSARCASARTNTEPKRRASSASSRLRRLAWNRPGPRSPSSDVQCAAWRFSASASASRMSRSSPDLRAASSR